MSNAALRQQLHQYIETTDDKKIEALFTLLEADIECRPIYSAEELEMLHKRAEKYIAGNTKTYTVDESLNKIRQQKKRAKSSL